MNTCSSRRALLSGDGVLCAVSTLHKAHGWSQVGESYPAGLPTSVRKFHIWTCWTNMFEIWQLVLRPNIWTVNRFNFCSYIKLNSKIRHWQCRLVQFCWNSLDGFGVKIQRRQERRPRYGSHYAHRALHEPSFIYDESFEKADKVQLWFYVKKERNYDNLAGAHQNLISPALNVDLRIL